MTRTWPSSWPRRFPRKREIWRRWRSPADFRSSRKTQKSLSPKMSEMKSNLVFFSFLWPFFTFFTFLVSGSWSAWTWTTPWTRPNPMMAHKKPRRWNPGQILKLTSLNPEGKPFHFLVPSSLMKDRRVKRKRDWVRWLLHLSLFHENFLMRILNFLDDVFAIDEVTMFDGENWNEKKYAVAGDILDGYLYDLLMTMLDERGVNREFVEKLSDYCSAYEHSLYINLLTDLQKFIK